MLTDKSIEELMQIIDEVPDVSDLERNYAKERVQINGLVDAAQTFVEEIAGATVCLNKLLQVIREKGQILDAILTKPEARKEH